MATQVKNKLRVYLILGVVAAIMIGAVAVFVLFFQNQGSKDLPKETIGFAETQPEQMLEPELAETLPQSAYSPENFTYDGAFLTCDAGDFLVGIDVSHHQKEIDWTAVKNAGVDFVMVRLGYRALAESGELYEDRYVYQNLQGARDAGLLVGAYFYSQAVSTDEAVEEALYALTILNGFSLDLPLAFDWEMEKRNAQVSRRTATACAYAFCNAVEQAGYEPMIYFNTHQALELVDMSYLTEYPWWLAKYNTEGTFVCRFDMWQYSCTGSVDGINGNVDLNILNISGIS